MTTFRGILNRAGVVFDPQKQNVLFAEDINAITNSINSIEASLENPASSGVSSFMGRVGDVIGAIADYTTDMIFVTTGGNHFSGTSLTGVLQGIDSSLDSLDSSVNVYSGTFPFPRIVGSYVQADFNATANTTVAIPANSITYIPFIPNRDLSFDQISLEVTTLISGGRFVLGVYGSDVNSLPSGLLLSSSELTADVVGAKVFNSGGSLTRGKLYFLCVRNSLAVTVRAAALASCNSFGLSSNVSTAKNTCFRITSTYANSLPVSPVFVLANLVSVALPCIRLRVS